MKISAWHKAAGDSVEWCNHFDDCELMLKDVGVMKMKIKQAASRTEGAYRRSVSRTDRARRQ